MTEEAHLAPDAPRESLAMILTARIRASGPIPFSEFMRECLYHPEHGYYSRPGTRRFGDYYTSVDVHPIFGRLLARQLAEMWTQLGSPVPFLAMECGAGTGRLAANILDFAARELPDFYAAMKYVAVERSAARRAEHGSRLGSHAAAGRVSSPPEILASVPSGCIFSNELLDALPVHRVLMRGGDLCEVCVGIEGGHFTEVLRKPSTPLLEQYFRAQGIALEEGRQA